jgi:hypothetical protein
MKKGLRLMEKPRFTLGKHARRNLAKEAVGIKKAGARLFSRLLFGGMGEI